MLSFDSVKLRLERQQELSFLEFNYMILQAYDFVELYKRTGCILQMGGSDQWGNIVSGIDLGRRMTNAQLFALTAPLITTSSGARWATAAGAVWLNADLLSPYDYWQYWRNTEDGDVALPAVHSVAARRDRTAAALQGQEVNEAKKVLAPRRPRWCTARCRRQPARPRAAPSRKARWETLPTVDTARAELEAGLGVLAAFVKAGLVASNGEARRQIKNGGLRVNDDAVTDEKMMLTPAHLTPQGVVKLSLGKKRHVLLKPV